MFAMMVEMLAALDRRIAELDKEITRHAREDEVARRLMTIRGIGPISATAIAAIARKPRPSRRAATLPPRWGWCQNRRLRAVNRSWGQSPEGASER